MGPSRKVLEVQLRDKALLALEDAIQEHRYRTPHRSFAVRFALAYLWAADGCRDRGAFDSFWANYVSPHTPWSFGPMDLALGQIYRKLGLDRPPHVAGEMWKRWAEERGIGGPGSSTGSTIDPPQA